MRSSARKILIAITMYNTYSKCLNTRTLATIWSVLYIVYRAKSKHVYNMFQCLSCYEVWYLLHVIEQNVEYPPSCFSHIQDVATEHSDSTVTRHVNKFAPLAMVLVTLLRELALWYDNISFSNNINVTFRKMESIWCLMVSIYFHKSFSTANINKILSFLLNILIYERAKNWRKYLLWI